MRSLLCVVVLSVSLLAARSGILDRAPVVAYVDSIHTWWGCDVPAGIGMPTSPTTGPNVIALSFWTTSGPVDAATLWANLPQYVPDNCGFGSNTAEMQESILNNFHKNGVKIITAAFGATDYPTNKDPTESCTALAKFVLDNKLDGVDLDYEDSGAFEQGVGAQWLITCTKVLRQYLPKGQYILTHAPQGPYFTTASIYPDSAYLRIDREVGQLIDWYNLQYYNQGASSYTTYDDCFGASSAYPGTAVFELRGLNSKIAVGKPATQKDANNGWIPASTLAEWLQKANKEAGWCGGAMYWQFASDADKSFGSTMRSAVDSFYGCSNEML